MQEQHELWSLFVRFLPEGILLPIVVLLWNQYVVKWIQRTGIMEVFRIRLQEDTVRGDESRGTEKRS